MPAAILFFAAIYILVRKYRYTNECFLALQKAPALEALKIVQAPCVPTQVGNLAGFKPADGP